MSLTSYHPGSVCASFTVFTGKEHLAISEYLVDRTIQHAEKWQVSMAPLPAVSQALALFVVERDLHSKLCDSSWPDNYQYK